MRVVDAGQVESELARGLLGVIAFLDVNNPKHVMNWQGYQSTAVHFPSVVFLAVDAPKESALLDAALAAVGRKHKDWPLSLFIRANYVVKARQGPVDRFNMDPILTEILAEDMREAILRSKRLKWSAVMDSVGLSSDAWSNRVTDRTAPGFRQGARAAGGFVVGFGVVNECTDSAAPDADVGGGAEWGAIEF